MGDDKFVDLGIPGIEDAVEVGSGGFASVYRARQSGLYRTVAVKVIRAEGDEDTIRRFAREARALGTLSEHRGIVTVHDVGTTSRNHPYLVMQYCPGGSLRDRLRVDGPLPDSDARELMAQVCDALAAAHDRGILHRDLKPANILVGPHGEALVADFGIAALGGVTAGVSTALAFTPSYAPPEVFRGEGPTAAGDVYSVGASLYHLVTGREPFARDDGQPLDLLALAGRIATEEPDDPRRFGVPNDLAELIGKAMATRAARRPSMVELAALLRDRPQHGAGDGHLPSPDASGATSSDGAAAPLPEGITEAPATVREAAPRSNAQAPTIGVALPGPKVEPTPVASGPRGSVAGRRLAVAAALIAAAVLGLVLVIGSPDDDAGETAAGTSEETAASPDGSPAPVVSEAETGASPRQNPEPAPPREPTGESTDRVGLADDSVHGVGAALWETIHDAQPGPADEALDPVVITMATIENSPVGSFPDIREGARAAVDNINENLGGVDGRPVVLDVCVHGADPVEATDCASRIVAAEPTLHIQGVSFFNPLMWPILVDADLPILQTVPIFISDFDTPGVLSTEGGCVTAFPSAAQYAAEVLESDKVAVIHPDTGPGLECYIDTQERFFRYYEDTIGMDFQSFPDTSGDFSDSNRIAEGVQQFLADAENPSVFFGIQAPDCNDILTSLAATDVEATLVASGTCRDAVVEANPAAVGVHFGSAGKIFGRPDLWSDWEIKTADARQAAIDAFGPESPQSSFMEVAHDVVMTAWVQLSLLARDGSDLSDPAEIRDAFMTQSNLHRHNGPAIGCTDNAAEYRSVCNKLAAYYVWDGERYQLGPLEGRYLDVGDLLMAVGEAYPRGAS